MDITMKTTIEEQSKASKEMVTGLFDKGFDPKESLGVVLNAALVLASMTDASCGYVSSSGHSVLLSEAGKEHEALSIIEKYRANGAEEVKPTPKPTEDGSNVFQIKPSK